MDKNPKVVLPISSVRDITAIVLILSALPSPVSCFILTAFILSGSSKSIGGRFLISKLLSKRLEREPSAFIGGLLVEPGSLIDTNSTNADKKSKSSESPSSAQTSSQPQSKGATSNSKSSSLRSRYSFNSAFLAIGVNSIIVLIAFCMLPRHFNYYITLFAKTIVASELIGSSSVTSTTVTSITTVTASGVTTTTTTTTSSTSYPSSSTNTNAVAPPVPGQQTSGTGSGPSNNFPSSYSNTGTTAGASSSFLPPPPPSLSPTSNTSSNTKKPSHESIIRNNKFINASVCFLTVINFNYFVREWLVTTELGMHFPQRNHLMPLIEPQLHRFYPYLKYASFILNYLYLYLSVHVIIINVSTTLKKYFVYPDETSTLDSLSMIAPNVPSLRNNHRVVSFPMNMNSSSSLNISALNSASSTNITGIASGAFAGAGPTINLEPEENKLVEINIEEANSESISVLELMQTSRSVVANNFEIFCSSPIGAKTGGSSSSLFDKSQSSHTTSAGHSSAMDNTASHNHVNHLAGPRSGNRSRSGTLGNSTTIVNKVLTSVLTTQPLWSLLAATKTILFKPAYFSGKVTKYKNNGGKFVTKINNPSYLAIATVYIDDTKAIFKVLDVTSMKKFVSESNVGITVKLNNIEWIHKKFLKSVDNEIFICIYGLTPLFQYELEVYKESYRKSDNSSEHADERSSSILLSHCLFNTVSSSAVLNQSPEVTTSLLTLQLSLSSTIDKLNQSRSKFKKFKRDENKKHSELKRDIDNLRNKISKYNTKQSVESRTSGKLKGLKHSVLQLEGEIEDLKKSVSLEEEESSKADKKFRAEESILKSQIQKLSKSNDVLEASINKLKRELKNLEMEYAQHQSKTERLNSKKEAKLEELNRIQVEIKNTKKNEMMLKSSKRNKRYQERYEVILPKLSNAITELQRELEEILTKSNDSYESAANDDS